jgi:hypothetical protein
MTDPGLRTMPPSAEFVGRLAGQGDILLPDCERVHPLEHKIKTSTERE